MLCFAGHPRDFKARLRQSALRRSTKAVMCITVYTVRCHHRAPFLLDPPASSFVWDYIMITLTCFILQEEADELKRSLTAVCENLESLKAGGVPWQQVRSIITLTLIFFSFISARLPDLLFSKGRARIMRSLAINRSLASASHMFSCRPDTAFDVPKCVSSYSSVW